MLGPGRAVVYRHEGYDVVRITDKGDVLIRHFGTGDEIWADYYDIEFADPYADPGALLDALATIRAAEFDDPSGADVEGEEPQHEERRSGRVDWCGGLHKGSN